MKPERIIENRTRSLLLVDAEPGERRLVSAIAGRAGWSVVGAADGEAAVSVLQGPHGREVQTALLGNWDAETGPGLIAMLRRCRDKLPIIVVADGESVRSQSKRCARSLRFLSRPVVRNDCSQR